MSTENETPQIKTERSLTWGGIIALGLLAVLSLGVLIYFLVVSVP